MEGLNAVSPEQRQVVERGNVPQQAYQAPENTVEELRALIKNWGGEIPVLSVFVKKTNIFLEYSYPMAFGQIVRTLDFFHRANSINEKITWANHLVLSCNYWLRKANVKAKDTKPLDYANSGQLPERALKLKDSESRRVPVLALSIMVSNWLNSQGQAGTVLSAIDAMTKPNQGMTPDHGSKDVSLWNKYAGTRLPEAIKTRELRDTGPFDDLDERLVSLDNDSQKRLAKLVFRNGLAYRWVDRNFENFDDVGYAPFNTSSFGVHFVMDRRGRIYARTLSSAFFFHSSLVGFADALSAGFIVAKQGKITGIKNDSGHYKPGAEEMVKALLRLELYGVKLSGVTVERVAGSHRLGGRTFTAADLLKAPSGRWPDEDA